MVFCGLWFVFTFLMFSEKNVMQWVLYKAFPINASLIILFLINTEILIGKLLVKKGIAYYVMSLLTLIVIFFISQTVIMNEADPDIFYSRCRVSFS